MKTMTHNISINFYKSFVNLLIVNKCIRETHPAQRYFAEIIHYSWEFLLIWFYNKIRLQQQLGDICSPQSIRWDLRHWSKRIKLNIPPCVCVQASPWQPPRCQRLPWDLPQSLVLENFCPLELPSTSHGLYHNFLQPSPNHTIPWEKSRQLPNVPNFSLV